MKESEVEDYLGIIKSVKEIDEDLFYVKYR